MNDLEKSTKKVVAEKKVESDMKSVSAMSIDELNNLIPITYSICAQERKKQKGSFSYTAHVELKKKAGLGFDFYLEEAEFLLIRAAKKCREGFNAYSFLSGSCRIFKAKRKNDGSIFYGVEVALTPDIFRSKYLSDAQVRLLETVFTDVPVVDRTNVASNKEFVPFDGTNLIAAID